MPAPLNGSKPNGKCSNGSSTLDSRQRRNRLHGGKVFEAGGEMNEMIRAGSIVRDDEGREYTVVNTSSAQEYYGGRVEIKIEAILTKDKDGKK
jgi:hypothetical protein